jgi:hypothetical protein
VNITRVDPTELHEGASATYTVKASSTVSQDLTVYYAMSGTATQNTDYFLVGTEGQAIIKAGRSSAAVTLKARYDSATEGTETATMTLQPGAGYKVGKNNQATLSILDGQ